MSLPSLIALSGAGVLILAYVTFAFLRSSSARTRKTRSSDAIVRAANRALAQNPRDAGALSDLGDVCFSNQNWEKAATAYSRLADLVATNPDLDEPLILARHGLASMQLKRYPDAYRSLVLAARANPDVFEVNFNLGRLELKRKSYERAASVLLRANAARPDHVPTRRYLGQAAFRIKRYADATRLLKSVVESTPDDKESVFYLGQANYELGQFEQAAGIFGQLRTDPVFGPRACLIAGSIHLKGHNYTEAELDFQIGLKHENVAPDILLELNYRLAATYTRLQNVEQALAVLMQIARINPAYKDVAQQIERARELAGNKNLQTFLMGPASEFVGLGRRIVNSYFASSKVKITDIRVNRSESADVLAEIRTRKWEDIVVFRLMRTSGQTGELVVRDLQSRMKDVHAGRGLCLTAGTFSEGAHEFVEARFIDLVEKEAFLKVLQRA